MNKERFHSYSNFLFVKRFLIWPNLGYFIHEWKWVYISLSAFYSPHTHTCRIFSNKTSLKKGTVFPCMSCVNYKCTITILCVTFDFRFRWKNKPCYYTWTIHNKHNAHELNIHTYNPDNDTWLIFVDTKKGRESLPYYVYLITYSIHFTTKPAKSNHWVPSYSLNVLYSRDTPISVILNNDSLLTAVRYLLLLSVLILIFSHHLSINSLHLLCLPT